MAFHLSRTLALKAALVAGLLLIFFNLIGLRLEIKFDRSPINIAHSRWGSATWRRIREERHIYLACSTWCFQNTDCHNFFRSSSLPFIDKNFFGRKSTYSSCLERLPFPVGIISDMNDANSIIDSGIICANKFSAEKKCSSVCCKARSSNLSMRDVSSWLSRRFKFATFQWPTSHEAHSVKILSFWPLGVKSKVYFSTLA